MEKVIRVARSFEEADQADRDYYRSLTPEQRLEILLELNRRWPRAEHDPALKGFERVYRILKLS